MNMKKMKSKIICSVSMKDNLFKNLFLMNFIIKSLQQNKIIKESLLMHILNYKKKELNYDNKMKLFNNKMKLFNNKMKKKVN